MVIKNTARRKETLNAFSMNIEEEIFSAYQVNKDILLSYGFNLFKDVYTCQKDINNDFKALIVVDENNVLKGKVIEKAFDEEFIQLRNEAYQGGFIGEIREAYKDLLIDIRNNCYG